MNDSEQTAAALVAQWPWVSREAAPGMVKAIAEAIATAIEEARRDVDQRISQLTDHLDMMRDEFRRIHVLAIPTMPEIQSLCLRGIATIDQKVPVIAQRDQAEAERDRLRAENAELRAALQKIGEGKE